MAGTIQVLVDASAVKTGMRRYQVESQVRAMQALELIGLDIVSQTKKRLKWRRPLSVNAAVRTYKSGQRMSEAAWARTGIGGSRFIVRDTPGGRATGRLANSYTAELVRAGNNITLTVGTGVKYAKFVEGYPRAPRRHFLPFATAPDFELWFKRHGIILPPDAKGWMTGGEGATTPHLGPAAQEVLPKAITKLRELARGI